jgi:hypothetical protein
MTTPIEQLAFRPTGAPSPNKVTLGDYSARVVNAKDYGAVGNGATDDTDAIQAAFNAALNMSMFQGSINGATGILTVSGAATVNGETRNKSFATIVAGSVVVFPDMPLIPPNFFQPTRLTIAAFGTGGTTGTGGAGTYQLISSGGNFNTQASQPMLACPSTQQACNTRKTWIPAGNYWIYSPLYACAALGVHIYGDGNGATQLLYLADGTQKNILINAGGPANNFWTPIIAMDAIAYSKIEGISLGTYPQTQNEQGAYPTSTRFTGSISGDVLTVSAGPYDGAIVAGMTVSYALFGVGQSPVGLAILAFGTGGTTGTGGLGTYKLSFSPGITDPDMAATSVVPRMTGILAYQSGVLGTTSAIHFENMNISDMYAGIVGDQGAGNVENCILFNVGFARCGFRGLWLTGQNVLNWQVYGGGASSCGWLSTYNVTSSTGAFGAAYYSGVGSIGCIYGISNTANQWDVVNDGGQQMHLAGGSFEGGPAFHGLLTWSSASGGTAKIVTTYPHQLKFNQDIVIYILDGGTPASYEGRFFGTVVDANTITYPLANPGGSGGGYVSPTNSGTVALVGTNMSINSCFFRGGDTSYTLPIYCVSGSMTVTGSAMGAHTGTSGIISWLINGSVTFDSTLFSGWQNGSFKSSGAASELYIRGGSAYLGTPTAPFSLFSGGFVREYNLIQTTTVSALPTASAVLKGLRGSVTDGDSGLAWGATAVNSGAGATYYDVVCNGAHWTVVGK